MNAFSYYGSESEARPSVRVLYVEDQIDCAFPVMRRLAWSPIAVFEVAHRCDVTSALMELEQRPYDVLLVDLGLPDADGMETVVSMAALSRHLPVLFLTAWDDERLAADAVRAGAQDYLVKQHCHGDDVPRAILAALERHRQSVRPPSIRETA